MNHWQYEQYKQIDKYYRQRMMAELQAEKLIQRYHVYHPGLFERIMLRLGSWMISKGRQIRHRYEIPSSACRQRTTSNLIG